MESKYKEKVIRTYGEEAWYALQKEVLLECLDSLCKKFSAYLNTGNREETKHICERMELTRVQLMALKLEIGFERYRSLKSFEEYTRT
jgi:hypothetical protein